MYGMTFTFLVLIKKSLCYNLNLNSLSVNKSLQVVVAVNSFKLGFCFLVLRGLLFVRLLYGQLLLVQSLQDEALPQ